MLIICCICRGLIIGFSLKLFLLHALYDSMSGWLCYSIIALLLCLLAFIAVPVLDVVALLVYSSVLMVSFINNTIFITHKKKDMRCLIYVLEFLAFKRLKCLNVEILVDLTHYIFSTI